jgi:hypothetical protein
MANVITVSTIGAAPLREVKGLHGEEAVERMITHWQSKFENVLPDRPDLIVVPEACDRYPAHTIEERLAYYEFRGSRIREFFADTAREHSCYITYPAVREIEDGTRRNSIQIIDRSGKAAGVYNKNHVVIHETLEENTLCGKDAQLIECDFGQVACAICFDLNFDEVRLKYVKQKPDLVIFSSMYHGGLMQNYWAYSCRSHLVSAITGQQSGMLSPLGTCIASTTNYYDYISAKINLDCRVAHFDENREKFDAMKKKYGLGVTIEDPGHLGCICITNEKEDCTIDDIIKEFEIELIDDYFERSLKHHHDPQNIE